MNFAEPSRDSYTARETYAWPTIWVLNGATVATANVQLVIGVPQNSTGGLTAGNIGSAMLAASVLFTSPVLRAEIISDAATGAFGPDGKTPIMPVSQWYRDNLTYNSTTYVNRSWSFTGALEQMSIFSPSGSGDDVTRFTLKRTAAGTNSAVNVLDSYKKADDIKKLAYNWNPFHVDSTTDDAANTNWPSADVFHLALDFDDVPNNFLPVNVGDILELDLTLAQATASQKNFIVLSQVYNDAFSN